MGERWALWWTGREAASVTSTLGQDMVVRQRSNPLHRSLTHGAFS